MGEFRFTRELAEAASYSCGKEVRIIIKKINMKKICIITPSYITSSPRTVKEADALFKAGFDVRVVFSQGNLKDIRQYDGILLKEKQWRWHAVGWSPFREKERMLYFKSKLRHNICKRLPALLSPFVALAECGEGRVYKELARLAASEKADIYIGHYPAAWQRLPMPHFAGAQNLVMMWKTFTRPNPLPVI